jgi:hypothetical protein
MMSSTGVPLSSSAEATAASLLWRAAVALLWPDAVNAVLLRLPSLNLAGHCCAPHTYKQVTGSLPTPCAQLCRPRHTVATCQTEFAELILQGCGLCQHLIS